MTNPTPVRMWQPGQSGNPSGKSKSIVDALRRGRAEFLESYPIMNRLFIRAGLGEVELERSQAWAIEKLFDRYLGKNPQTIDIDQQEGAGEDISSIPAMTHQEIQLLKNRMVMELVYSLKEDGRLDHMLRLIDEGWRPDSIDVESVTITQEERKNPKNPKKTKQLAIEEKK